MFFHAVTFFKSGNHQARTFCCQVFVNCFFNLKNFCHFLMAGPCCSSSPLRGFTQFQQCSLACLQCHTTVCLSECPSGLTRQHSFIHPSCACLQSAFVFSFVFFLFCFISFCTVVVAAAAAANWHTQQKVGMLLLLVEFSATFTICLVANLAREGEGKDCIPRRAAVSQPSRKKQ